MTTTVDLSLNFDRKERSPITCFKGGQLVLDINNGSLVKGDVWVRDGVIIDPLKLFYTEKRKPDCVINCSELIVSPGFIDIQINGMFPSQQRYLTQLIALVMYRY